MKQAIIKKNGCVFYTSQKITEMQKAQQEYEKHKYDGMSYSDIVVSLIREKYSLDDELALHRQKDSKSDEWNAYNAFCEECKSNAKSITFK